MLVAIGDIEPFKAWRSMFLPSLLLLPIFYLHTTSAIDIPVEVTPQTDITVAVTDPGNITYVCTVPTDAQPEWAVDTFQLVNPEDMIARQFAATGIYIEIVSPGVTRLVITPEGRDTRLMQKSMNTIVCRCTGIRSRDLEKGDTAITVSVTTYNRPEAPGNLTLDLIVGSLFLVWERPANALAQTTTTYNISIFNVTDSGNVLYEEARGQSATRFSIHALEESLHGMPCQQFQFLVTADNDAGVGITAVYNETVPLSANTSEIDATLNRVSLELGAGNDLTLVYEFKVCTWTTDVQSAEVIFHQNYVYLRCVFADRTLSRGCVFRFSPSSNGTGLQEFVLERDADEVVLSQCNMTMNQRSAYQEEGQISVFDIEPDGTVGSFRVTPMDAEVGRTNFTQDTGCVLMINEPLNPPQINVAAIVAPIVAALVLLTVIVIVVVLVVWGWRRGHLKQKLATARTSLKDTKQALTDEKAKKTQPRKPSMTQSTDGSYVAELHPGDLLDVKKFALTPSPSSHSDVTTPTTPPADSAKGGPPFPGHPPLPEPTGSTSSYSPPRNKARVVKRSFSEPSESVHSMDDATSTTALLKLSISKESVELKVQRNQLIERLRKDRKERSQKIKSRSRSVGNDMSEETAPLLTLSEIQISPDILEAISEERLEALQESSPSMTPMFQLGDPQNSPPAATNEIDCSPNPIHNFGNPNNPSTTGTNGTGGGVKIDGVGNAETTV